MPNNDPKVHLRGKGWHNKKCTACGVQDPRRHTRHPSEVTCDRCRRTLAMADAEVRATKAVARAIRRREREIQATESEDRSNE